VVKSISVERREERFSLPWCSSYYLQTFQTSIIEDRKLLGVLGIQGCVVCIHEKLQIDPLRFVHIRPINLVHLLNLGNKRNGEGGFSCSQKEAKQWRIWKFNSWPLYGLKFFNRSVITVLYIERTIAKIWLSSILDYF
jgi:hypothetical protein